MFLVIDCAKSTPSSILAGKTAEKVRLLRSERRFLLRRIAPDTSRRALVRASQPILFEQFQKFALCVKTKLLGSRVPRQWTRLSEQTKSLVLIGIFSSEFHVFRIVRI